jgi:hypothetical protein
MARNRNQCQNVHPPCYNSEGVEIPPCGSFDTQLGFDELTCLVCGRLTNLETGQVVPLEVQFAPCNL